MIRIRPSAHASGLARRFRPAGLLCLLLAGLSAAAATPDAMARAQKAFRDANAAYEKTEYDRAADLYRRAIDEGVADSRLYFNYADCLYRQNHPGMAILYYEKARKLDPDDPDIAYNLRFLNARIQDKVPVPEDNALTRALRFAHNAFSINEGLWIALGLFTFLGIGAMLWLFAGAAARTALGVLMAAAFLAMLALIPSLAVKIKDQETLHYAIVLKPAIDMFSGPGETFQVLTQVHEGTKFEIVENRGEWVSVKLANGKGGYVRLADLGKV